MNIVIVSKDSFFISGVIGLIQEAWSPGIDSPVFLIADEHRSLLVPDIVITDVCKMTAISLHPKLSGPARDKDNVRERYVSFFLAAQCPDELRSCSQHLIRLKKRDSARQLQKLVRRLNTPGYAKENHNAVVLSRQQAMVVKYTRLGLSLTDISRVTNLSIKTISTHKRALMRKLDIKNNSDFYRYALVNSTSR